MARKPSVINRFPGISVEGGLMVESVPKVGRKQRRPSHPFYVEFGPYQIQPFLCAPVLPGETMKNLLLQARCVSPPVANELIGWWNEYYFFYVKLTDLVDQWEELSAMLLTNTAPSFIGTSAITAHNYNGSGINFVSLCLQRVVQMYFRDEEELSNGSWNQGAAIDGGANYKAKVLRNNALQSLVLDSDTPVSETETMPGEYYPADLPAHLSAFEAQYDQWKELVAMEMTAATFEDWLRTFGVRAPREEKEDLHIPELLRYVREFAYPKGVIGTEGTTGPCMSWSIAERADKDRFFNEPGFVFGVTCARPKAYYSNKTGLVANELSDAFSWLPALLQDQPYTSLKKFDELTGPVRTLASDYWLDIRDLFMYGEQFRSVAPSNVVSLPDDSAVSGQPLNRDYPANADLAGFFTSGTQLKTDGRVDLTILSRVVDTTP